MTPERPGLPQEKTWDIIASRYTTDIQPFEAEYVEEINNLFQSFRLGAKVRVLELGAGSGHLSALLAEMGFDVTLLDFSEVAINKAKKTFEHRNLKGSFVLGDFLDTDWTKKVEGHYDIIWNSGVMEHFNAVSLGEALRSIRRVVARKYVFIVPNPRSFPYLLYRYYMTVNGRWDVGEEYVRGDYTQILEGSGFKNVYSKYMGARWTEFLVSVFVNEGAKSFPYVDLLRSGIMDEKDNYLIAYVAEGGGVDLAYNVDTYDQMTDRLGYLFHPPNERKEG
jgi:SAM-dependent methyltransferase